ncbi:type II toxin-antitoxin system VapC family toxin [Candidatus Pacearchaeota archaeon]|nr:type II toxin-antitoxin system VapC family toxin [Candidatus Pacearchaeota archaeon]
MKYIDSNIFIYPLLYDDSNSERCRKILFDIANGKIRAFTSVLTWDEIVYVLKKKKGHQIANKEGDKFLKFPNLKFLESDFDVIILAQKFIEKYNIAPRDAIHAATSFLKVNSEVISLDSDFDLIREIKRFNP